MFSVSLFLFFFRVIRLLLSVFLCISYVSVLVGCLFRVDDAPVLYFFHRKKSREDARARNVPGSFIRLTRSCWSSQTKLHHGCQSDYPLFVSRNRRRDHGMVPATAGYVHTIISRCSTAPEHSVKGVSSKRKQLMNS
jgi:hypothetical protein